MPRHTVLSRRSWLAGLPIAAQRAARAAAQPPLRLPQKVRLALIGVQGHIGEITGHLKEVPDVEFVAVADPEREGRRAFRPRTAGGPAPIYRLPADARQREARYGGRRRAQWKPFGDPAGSDRAQAAYRVGEAAGYRAGRPVAHPRGR